MKAFNREEGLKIAKYIFGMILMPLETDRKVLMEGIEGLAGILDQYETPKDRRKIVQYYIPAMERSVYIGEN
jgi:hypothetical protein